MARKQILTNDNILTDVKNILERPATLSYAEHKKANFPLLVFSAVMLIAMVIFQNYYLQEQLLNSLKPSCAM